MALTFGTLLSSQRADAQNSGRFRPSLSGGCYTLLHDPSSSTPGGLTRGVGLAALPCFAVQGEPYTASQMARAGGPRRGVQHPLDEPGTTRGAGRMHPQATPRGRNCTLTRGPTAWPSSGCSAPTCAGSCHPSRRVTVPDGKRTRAHRRGRSSNARGDPNETIATTVSSALCGPADPVAVPSDGVAPVAVQAHTGGDERFTELGQVVRVEAPASHRSAGGAAAPRRRRTTAAASGRRPPRRTSAGGRLATRCRRAGPRAPRRTPRPTRHVSSTPPTAPSPRWWRTTRPTSGSAPPRCRRPHIEGWCATAMQPD